MRCKAVGIGILLFAFYPASANEVSNSQTTEVPEMVSRLEQAHQVGTACLPRPIEQFQHTGLVEILPMSPSPEHLSNHVLLSDAQAEAFLGIIEGQALCLKVKQAHSAIARPLISCKIIINTGHRGA